MGQIVVNGAMIACPMGLPGTATLSIMPTSMATTARVRRRPSSRTILTTVARAAPSARRMPISRRCWLTAARRRRRCRARRGRAETPNRPTNSVANLRDAFCRSISD